MGKLHHSAILIVASLSCLPHPASAAVAAGTRTWPVHRLAAAPDLDGNVFNDPAWQTAPGLTGFCTLGGSYTVAKQSTARMGWTDKALYIAIDCEEPDIGRIDDKGKDGDALWLDNGIEVFLQVPGSSGVLQFIVNTSGARVMGEGRDQVAIGAWRAAAMKGEGVWSLEMAIPFACLGVAPAADGTWRGAVCRNIHEFTSGGDRFTSWPGLQERFREPERFANLEFLTGSLSPEQAAQVALQLNLSYRRHLASQIEELARTGLEYRAPIAKAATAERFAAEARDLERAWTRIDTLAADVASASLREVRSFIAMANDLKHRSYEIKYRFLIEQLLAD